jgi:hypothetical protein
MNPHSLMRGLDPRIQSQIQQPQTSALDCRVRPGNEGESFILRTSALNQNLGLGFSPQASEDAPFSARRVVANPLTNSFNLNQKVKP